MAGDLLPAGPLPGVVKEAQVLDGLGQLLRHRFNQGLLLDRPFTIRIDIFQSQRTDLLSTKRNRRFDSGLLIAIAVLVGGRLGLLVLNPPPPLMLLTQELLPLLLNVLLVVSFRIFFLLWIFLSITHQEVFHNGYMLQVLFKM